MDLLKNNYKIKGETMFKKLTLAVIAAFCTAAISAETAPAAQSLPKQGYVTLVSGDYTVTFMPTSFFRISGFAFQGKELFVSRGAASGTTIQPSVAEKLVSAKITVDDTVPAKVTYAPVKGNKVVLEREALCGDVRIFSKYTVTPEGLSWSIKYKLESVNKKPNYFYLYTMAWNNKFSEFVYSKKGVKKYGKLTNSGKWVINDDIEYMAVYDPDKKVAAVSRPLTAIPGEMRKNAIWDHKAYHKYFMMHKRPAWNSVYESPEYVMAFSAFAAEPGDWQTELEKTVKGK